MPKRKNNLTRKKLIIIFITAFVSAILYFLSNSYNFVPIEYNLSLGQIADKDIIAPFDFVLYKSENRIKTERDIAVSQAKPIYKISDNLKFNTIKNLDFIFEHFNNTIKHNSVSQIKKELEKNGYELSDETIKYLSNNKKRIELYNFITEKITNIMDVGIYPSNLNTNQISIFKNGKISVFSLNRLYSLDEAKQKLTAMIFNKKKKRAVEELSNLVLIANIVVDNNLTRIEKQKLKDAISVTRGKILKNEKIITKNQKITPGDIVKLNSLIKAQKEKYGERKSGEIIITSIGVFFILLLMSLLYYLFILQQFGTDFVTKEDLIIYYSGVLVSILILVIFNTFLEKSLYILPYAFSVLLIADIYGQKAGFEYNFMLFLTLAIFLKWNISVLFIHSLITIAGIYSLKISHKRNPITILLILIISSVIINIFMGVAQLNNIFILTRNIYSMLISVVVSFVLYIIFLPIIEKKLNIATDNILYELADLENPIIKKMSKIANGTYHHSIMVGNLAESAAEAIGANFLLARTASYYHDIGKMEHPEYFIENNAAASDIHDKLLPTESAIIIKNHIKDGINLAKKYRLPKSIIDVLIQHHGNGYIKYFYSKAKEIGLIINEDDFRYNGPKPQTKEAAIVMIADIVESTLKSKDNVDAETVKAVIENTINNLLAEKQLDESPLTLSDIKKIKSHMPINISGLYAKRIDYPDDIKQ